ncbi:large conductance mechanosensitive channel protein MscL [Lachnospiraceae bacterium MD1]|jgi:large conductance mechanosensitive channel|uniref:Large-conductance mechanosensitive channel n=1 Tax=Variimorphobacter saccharofermentans TaxID=2755051 RepID=A0A839JY65_9FIRM|nr:large conductance mechanosensitive channel protein MscL [Variimorphobacter saccharofermentans]MBB2182370.1 large conductance mechanosensitive channel protein MscL [Variimorphobacter saccharofermentans]
MLKEFKKFALRGNMIDLAVGIIIGGAFSGIVNSLVNDIIMPLLSLITQNINFEDWFFALDGNSYATLQAAKDAGAPTVNYGLFISGIINFVIMAFVVFLMVRWINKLKKPEPAAEPTTKQCPFCLSDINKNAKKCPHCTSELND